MKNLELNNAELKSLNNDEMKEIDGGGDKWWDVLGGPIARAGAFINGMIDECFGAPYPNK